MVITELLFFMVLFRKHWKSQDSRKSPGYPSEQTLILRKLLLDNLVVYRTKAGELARQLLWSCLQPTQCLSERISKESYPHFLSYLPNVTQVLLTGKLWPRTMPRKALCENLFLVSLCNAEPFGHLESDGSYAILTKYSA